MLPASQLWTVAGTLDVRDLGAGLDLRFEASYLSIATPTAVDGTMGAAGQVHADKALGQVPQGTQARGSDGQP